MLLKIRVRRQMWALWLARLHHDKSFVVCLRVCVSISCCGMQQQLSCVSEMAWLGWLSCFRALKQHSDMGCAHTQQHERMRLSHHEWHGVRQRAVVQKCEPIVHWVATWSRAIAGYGGDYVCYLLLKIVVMIVDFAIIVRIFFLRLTRST